MIRILILIIPWYDWLVMSLSLSCDFVFGVAGGVFFVGVESVFFLELCAFSCKYNPGHNILELCNVLVQAWFAACKVELDIWYNKLGVRIASRVAERIMT